jgi:hypothetical protein
MHFSDCKWQRSGSFFHATFAPVPVDEKVKIAKEGQAVCWAARPSLGVGGMEVPGIDGRPMTTFAGPATELCRGLCSAVIIGR